MSKQLDTWPGEKHFFVSWLPPLAATYIIATFFIMVLRFPVVGYKIQPAELVFLPLLAACGLRYGRLAVHPGGKPPAGRPEFPAPVGIAGMWAGDSTQFEIKAVVEMRTVEWHAEAQRLGTKGFENPRLPQQARNGFRLKNTRANRLSKKHKTLASAPPRFRVKKHPQTPA